MKFVEVFNLILDPLPEEFPRSRLIEILGPNAVNREYGKEAGRLRLQLAAHLVLRERAKPEDASIRPEGADLMDCDVHAYNSAEMAKEADAERDWHQHAMWPCAYAQLFKKFRRVELEGKLAADELRATYNTIYDWTHNEECQAYYCGEDGNCDCPYKNVGEDDEDGTAEKEHNKKCTCGIGDLQDRILKVLQVVEK